MILIQNYTLAIFAFIVCMICWVFAKPLFVKYSVSRAPVSMDGIKLTAGLNMLPDGLGLGGKTLKKQKTGRIFWFLV